MFTYVKKVTDAKDPTHLNFYKPKDIKFVRK